MRRSQACPTWQLYAILIVLLLATAVVEASVEHVVFSEEAMGPFPSGYGVLS
jgi:hypothetical protein